MAGTTWRGWNRGALFAVLGQRKFFKRVHLPSPDSSFSGENVLARSNGLTQPWVPRFGGRGILPFAVLPPGAGPHPSAPADALVIAYGPVRSAFNPMGWVVDHLVRPEPGRDLLLGESVLLVPGGRGVFIEHFLLERHDG